MPTSDLRFRRRSVYILTCILFLGALSACEDSQSPPSPPSALRIVSGDGQYTKKGTRLEQPIVVSVAGDKGAPASNVTVHFQVVEGGGSLSRASATTNNDGQTSVKWTVGPSTGNNRLKVTVSENSALSAFATATSAEYYCIEEDPTFVAKFTPAHSFMMATRQSGLSPGTAGLLRFDLNTGGPTPTFTGTLVQGYPDGAFLNTVRDCVFSANGDLFISWSHTRDEIVKVATNGNVSHFVTIEPAPLDATPGTELAMTPDGVLMGCDAVGPFYATCRDTLFRFEGAIFSGSDLTRDACNNDALACDPTSGDLYFIYKADRTLRKISFPDGIEGTPTITEVVTLPIEASDGAQGMVVDGTDSSIYILADQATSKKIYRVSAGTLSTAFDFTTRGPGDAAGVQSDLAIDRQLKFIYTLDTKNNVLLAFGLPTSAQPGELVTIASAAGANDASDANSGERVGLDVIPAAGP